MKNLYYNTQKFMFRIPNDVERKLDFTEEEIKNACLDAKFREKVSIASPALVDMMDLYIKNPEKLSEKKLVNFQNSIMKYLIRSKNRTTPFGLFSGVGLGKFGDSDTFDVSGAKYQKKVNIDSEWLFGFISQLEKVKSQRLRFKINDACYIKGNRANGILMIWEANIMIIPVSVKNQSIDSSGITSDYKAAISEYIWNGFEANAKKVSIEYTLNEAFGVKELIIKDNGDGINYDELGETFGAFLASKKNLLSLQIKSKANKGKGRFSFIAFSSNAEWHTVYKDNNVYKECLTDDCR